MTAASTRLAVLVCALWLGVPPGAAAQHEADARDGGHARKSGTYLKTGFAHWRGDIFNRGALTHWDVDLFGTRYNLSSLALEVETHFAGRFLGLSGFSLGYRKDGMKRADSGHMFSAALFGDVDFSVFALKVGGGAEWGMPSLIFDRTEFDQLGDGTVRYRHTHPDRNADVPFVGTVNDGALYPFVVVSAVQRPWIFLGEAGVRFNIMSFNFDDYEIRPGDELVHVFSRRSILMPCLFVNLGLRLF